MVAASQNRCQKLCIPPKKTTTCSSIFTVPVREWVCEWVFGMQTVKRNYNTLFEFDWIWFEVIQKAILTEILFFLVNHHNAQLYLWMNVRHNWIIWLLMALQMSTHCFDVAGERESEEKRGEEKKHELIHCARWICNKSGRIIVDWRAFIRIQWFDEQIFGFVFFTEEEFCRLPSKKIPSLSPERHRERPQNETSDS